MTTLGTVKDTVPLCHRYVCLSVCLSQLTLLILLVLFLFILVPLLFFFFFLVHSVPEFPISVHFPIHPFSWLSIFCLSFLFPFSIPISPSCRQSLCVRRSAIVMSVCNGLEIADAKEKQLPKAELFSWGEYKQPRPFERH